MRLRKLTPNKQLCQLGLALSVIAVAACSHNAVKPSDEMMTRAQTNIQQAESAEADEYAPVALRNAKQKLSSAESKIEEEDYTSAQHMLEEAMIDAEYALIKSRSEKSQQAARQLLEDINVLRQKALES